MTEAVEREFKRLLPLLRRVEKAVKDSGLDAREQINLMTMLAARYMGSAGAMMAAYSDAEAGRPFDRSDANIFKWTQAVAGHVVNIVRDGTVN
jgi:hypothetical protein